MDNLIETITEEFGKYITDEPEISSNSEGDIDIIFPTNLLIPTNASEENEVAEMIAKQLEELKREISCRIVLNEGNNPDDKFYYIKIEAYIQVSALLKFCENVSSDLF